MMLLRSVGLLSVSLFLAACGGGGGVDTPTVTPDRPTIPTTPSTPATPTPGFANALRQSETQADLLDRMAVTDPSDLPATGRISYSGFMTGDIYDPLTGTERNTLVGEMEIEANFANEDDFLTGSVDNFKSSDSQRVDGALDIDFGTLDRSIDAETLGAYDGVLSGRIRVDGKAADVDGYMSGNFRNGTRATDGSFQSELGDGDGYFDGTFSARRVTQ